MDFDEFLKEVAPSLGLHWRPFQRGGIRRKVENRIVQVGLSQFEDYLSKVKNDPAEQSHLSKILTVTISRFFRDREVFSIIETSLIPAMIKKRDEGDFKIWSIGCANGEEPYSLSMLWEEKFGKRRSPISLSILATDINERLLERAKEGKYKKSSLKEVPKEIFQKFFKIENGLYVLDPSIRESVDLRRHDIIHEEPVSGMDIILCRNLAFTYFSKETQISVLKRVSNSLKEMGHLVIGRDESLPLTYPTLFIPAYPQEKIYQRF